MSLTYTVARGDNLWNIAQENNVSYRDLIQANPQVRDPSLIWPGQRIKIPGDHFERTNANNHSASHSPNGPATAPRPDAPEAAPVRTTPNRNTTGPHLEQFPVGGNQFNIGYDAHWNNFDAHSTRHNSDYSLRSTGASHPTGHLGVDVFGPRGAPIVAPVTGVVSNINHNSRYGGKTVTVRRGNHYFYHAHLNSIAGGLQIGSPVRAGTSLGTLGNSGARGTAPHLHFSIYQGAGGYRSGTVNPFPYLKAAMPDQAVS